MPIYGRFPIVTFDYRRVPFNIFQIVQACPNSKLFETVALPKSAPIPVRKRLLLSLISDVIMTSVMTKMLNMALSENGQP